MRFGGPSRSTLHRCSLKSFNASICGSATAAEGATVIRAPWRRVRPHSAKREPYMLLDSSTVITPSLPTLSIASLLLTTEALVCEIPEKTAAPTPGGGGMAGMY